MTDFKDQPLAADSVESGLRLHLARGHALAASAAPVLRHFLVHRDSLLFSDGILARLRAMIADLARQLSGFNGFGEQQNALEQSLIEVPGLVAHVHGLALEWTCALRLQERLGLDPVLSPLMQALIASEDAEVSARAMQALAAQARFVQSSRRMQLALGELPAELLHGVLAVAQHGQQDAQSLRALYDEAATRLGLLAQVISGMGAGALAALSVGHAGVALFASALAQIGGQSRAAALMAMQDGQQARLALVCRAGGLKIAAIEDNMLALHDRGALPEGLARVSAERAGELLANMPPSSGDLA